MSFNLGARASMSPAVHDRPRPRRGRAPTLALIAFALGALAPDRARACKPISPVPVGTSRPVWEEQSALELVDESIEIECERGDRRTSRCRWRASYVYEGPGGDRAEGWIGLPTGEIDGARVEVGGALVADLGVVTDASSLLAVEVEDNGRVEVTVEADLRVYTAAGDTCTNPAGLARHWLVAVQPRAAVFEVAGGTEGLTSTSRVQAVAPPGWWALVNEGPRSRPRALDLRLPTKELRDITLRRRELLHGPFAAVGVGFGPRLGVRLRGGWEVAAPDFMLYSVAVEGDAREEMFVVPMIEIASPAFLGIVPSGGLGVGVPTMVLPDARPGFRAHASLSWPFVGLAGNVDVYPAFAGSELTLRGSLMLQVHL